MLRCPVCLARGCTSCGFPYFSEKNADKILIEVIDLAKSFKIESFLLGGTALGFVRNKRWLRTEIDIDIGLICKKETRDLFFEELIKRGYRRLGYRSWRNAWFKKEHLKIDLHFEYPSNWDSFLEKFEQIDYKGKTYNVPSPLRDYFKLLYGNWEIEKEKEDVLKFQKALGYIDRKGNDLDVDFSLLEKKKKKEDKTLPKIMIAILTKNDAQFLPKFLETMENLDYPKNKLRWIWMYGKSVDQTLDLILEFHKLRKYKYEVYEEPLFQRPIRSSLYNARLCNEFKPLHKGEKFILFVDTDVLEIPPNTLKTLVKANKDIVSPYPYIEGTSRFFDTYCFRFHGMRFDSVTWKGVNHDNLNPIFKDSKIPVELDSVGTLILIKSKVFKEIEWSNPAPHYRFCLKAREAGYHVWALPYLKIIHADIEKTENLHQSIEYYVFHHILPATELGKVGYKKKGEKWVLETWK